MRSTHALFPGYIPTLHSVPDSTRPSYDTTRKADAIAAAKSSNRVGEVGAMGSFPAKAKSPQSWHNAAPRLPFREKHPERDTLPPALLLLKGN